MISAACETIWDANGNANAVVMSPREFGILDRFKDSLTQPLNPLPSYTQLSEHFTTSIPVNLDSLATPATQTTSELYVGDFSEVVACIRSNWTVEATRIGSETFERLQCGVRLYGRFDVAVLHPAHFVVLNNLKATA